MALAGRQSRRSLSTPSRILGTSKSAVPLTVASQSRTYSSGKLGALKDHLKISEEVRDALATNKPVVALESTIYTHGALGDDLDLEGVVRRNGGVPAVCGILAGVPTVGLLPDEIKRMVENSPRKCSRRDIASLVGKVCEKESYPATDPTQGWKSIRWRNTRLTLSRASWDKNSTAAQLLPEP